MLFRRREGEINKNKRENMIKELTQACLNPNYLAERLSSVLFKITQCTTGHIHFHFRAKSDHIILIWSEGTLQGVVAKSPYCKKGEYEEWENSQFSSYQPEDIFKQLYQQIKRIKIDRGDFRKGWSSYTKFIKWMAEN